MNIGRASLIPVLALLVATPAAAQVTYRHGVARHISRHVVPPVNADDNLSYATHPSFQIFDTPYGPQTRVVYRCAYPNGWNLTDARRDMEGIPPGIDHTCANTSETADQVRARY